MKNDYYKAYDKRYRQTYENNSLWEISERTKEVIDTLKKYKNCICTIYIWKRYSIIIWIYKKLTVHKQKIIKTIDKIWKKGI